jgi:hypothetical protein
MRIKMVAAAALLGVAALGLSACAETLNATVSRYQAMPAPQGQTFAVVPGEGMAARGGLEFDRYAGVVSQQLAARGYAPAANAGSASMIVQLGYGVDHGQVRYVEQPGLWGGFGDPFWGRGFYRSRFGWGRPRFAFGWDDPFWFDDGVDSYIEYHGEVDLHIRSAGGQPLFDGRAQARSDTNRLDVLVPDLVEALFTGFPGQSGEVVKITVPARHRQELGRDG